MRATIFAVLLLAAVLGFASPARAADDIAAAQGVIRSQEQAFSRDDAMAAYSYAAPGIRQLFPEASIFMSMVQHSYAPVYRHRSFDFGEAKSDGDLSPSACTSSTRTATAGKHCIRWSDRPTVL